MIPEGERNVQNNEPILRGQFKQDQNQIEIDPSLLSGDRPPYQAVETYFHEAQHAYQHYAIDHPEFHKDSAQVREWNINETAYIDQEDVKLGLATYSHYRWQPIEADAHQTARERTDELYVGQYGDKSQYPAYATQKANEVSANETLAEIELNTTDYEEEARHFVLSRHEAQMGEVEGASEAEDPEANKVAIKTPSQDSPISESGLAKRTEEETSEEDYTYGHGR